MCPLLEAKYRAGGKEGGACLRPQALPLVEETGSAWMRLLCDLCVLVGAPGAGPDTLYEASNVGGGKGGRGASRSQGTGMQIKLSPDMSAVRPIIERQPRRIPGDGVEPSAALGGVRET